MPSGHLQTGFGRFVAFVFLVVVVHHQAFLKVSHIRSLNSALVVLLYRSICPNPLEILTPQGRLLSLAKSMPIYRTTNPNGDDRELKKQEKKAAQAEAKKQREADKPKASAEEVHYTSHVPS